MSRSTGPDKLTVEALYLRCEGLCEGCGQPLRGERGPELGGHQVSHRGPRGKGGTRRAEINDVQNLMLLNEDCHRWIEDAGRGWAYDHGFLVRSGFIPALQPVWLYGVPWGERGERAPSRLKVLLTDDAAYRRVEDVEVLDATG